MLADDRAGRDCQRLSIATALLALADGPVPAPDLSAGGPTAAARVGRLVVPARPLGLGRTALGGLCLIAAVAAPFVVALAPALAAAGAGYCPIGAAIA